MTNNAQAELVVTQADREAAARWAKSNSRHAQAANMLRGSCDTAPLVQAFARHRTAEIERMAGEVEALRAAVKVLRDGYADAVGGYRYIIQRYGRMDGVGWDRVIDHYDQWVMIPECEGLLAGSHKLPAQQDKVTGQ